jgi:hypothetical protein
VLLFVLSQLGGDVKGFAAARVQTFENSRQVGLVFLNMPLESRHDLEDLFAKETRVATFVLDSIVAEQMLGRLGFEQAFLGATFEGLLV